uniref:NAD-dependent epimerase/dehydratase domain-containing protein n=1 Tax=Bionectria ochroleuca TaxID=29856 RepID=A0A8H7N481_BIOOC
MDRYVNSQASSSSVSLASGTPPTTPGATISEFFPANTNRSILVIGGLGFIGSHTSLELLKAGHNVIVVDDLSNSFADVFSRIQQLAKDYYAEEGIPEQVPTLKFHKFDYRSSRMRYLLETEVDPITRESLIDGVIHFAAFKSVSDSIKSPISYYQNNVCGLVNLVELLGEHNIRKFVFSSSATVYGTKADDNLPLREEDLVHHDETYLDDDDNEVVCRPAVAGLQSPYARSKYFCEAILADIAKSDPAWRIVALRYFNPIGCHPSGLLGEDPKGVPTNLFPVITQVLTGEREKLHVFGKDWTTRDQTAVRDFIHVSDVARGHVKAIDYKATSAFRTFNLGSGTGTTVKEAVAALQVASNRSIPCEYVGRRDGDVGFCVASNNRAAKELGWKTEETIPVCARDLWNYVSKHKGIKAQ